MPTYYIIDMTTMEEFLLAVNYLADFADSDLEVGGRGEDTVVVDGESFRIDPERALELIRGLPGKPMRHEMVDAIKQAAV